MISFWRDFYNVKDLIGMPCGNAINRFGQQSGIHFLSFKKIICMAPWMYLLDSKVWNDDSIYILWNVQKCAWTAWQHALT